MGCLVTAIDSRRKCATFTNTNRKLVIINVNDDSAAEYFSCANGFVYGLVLSVFTPFSEIHVYNILKFVEIHHGIVKQASSFVTFSNPGEQNTGIGAKQIINKPHITFSC